MTGVYLAGVLVVTAFVLIVVPRIVFPLGEIPGTWLDRTVAGAVALSALTFAAMYVLGAINLLETLAIVAVWVGAWWFFKGRRAPKGRLRRGVQRFFTYSDLAESKGPGGAARELRDGARDELGRRGRRWFERVGRASAGPGAWLVSAGVLLVLVVSAYLRYRRAWGHVELVPQDSYLALFTTKALNEGQMLAEGIYPQGVIMWMSMLDRFFPFNSHQFTRFIGPTMSVIELVALYWVVSRVSRSRSAGLASIAILGLFAGDPALLVDWSRQIGAMIQEFALAYAIVSLVYAGYYMVERHNWQLALAGASMFAAVTSHTVTIIPLAIGYATLVVVGLVTARWTAQTLSRFVVVGLSTALVGNVYFLIGALKGRPLVDSFQQYNPSNFAGFTGTGADVPPAPPGEALTTNPYFQLAIAGAVIAVIVGGLLAAARRRQGALLLGYGATSIAMMLVYDFVAVRYGILFRVRVAWVTAVFLVIAIGLGLGALINAAASASRVRDLLWERRSSNAGLRTALELAGIVLAAVLVLSLWPNSQSLARAVSPSGYTQATEVSLDLIQQEEKLTYTFVGVSEQFQEASFYGFFVEAWVFARDVTFHEVRDPAYELAIPTDTVYVFVEKQVFRGPEARPFGPTEEYYRNTTKRERIMQRIFRWMEEYRRFHRAEVDVVYDDPQLRVYRIERDVALEVALRSPAFKNYEWLPGQLFDEDGDISADRVEPDPEAAIEAADPGGPRGGF